MKTEKEIEEKIKEFERKLIMAKSDEEKTIIKSKIISLKWVINKL